MLLCHQPVRRRRPLEWCNGHFRNSPQAAFRWKKKKNHRIREIFLCWLFVLFCFLIEPFLPLCVSYGHKWLSRIGAPAEANLSLPLKLWQLSLVAATPGNLFNCSTPLLCIFKRIMILLSFFLRRKEMLDILCAERAAQWHELLLVFCKHTGK